jgi:hypothetical protein
MLIGGVAPVWLRPWTKTGLRRAEEVGQAQLIEHAIEVGAHRPGEACCLVNAIEHLLV